ncbi:MAG: flagellar protein FlgJ [Alphaproteobacteria bacterium]|jgi:flagellar protein FlgJ
MDILSTATANKQYGSAPELQRASSVKFLAPSKSSAEKAEKAAHDFESFFLYQMLELTDPGTAEGFDGGKGEEMFRQIRNEHVADAMTKAGGIGIADTIYDQLLKIQENNQ